MRPASARPLEGVPFTVKDLQQTKGVPTQMGSRLYEGHIPDVDTPCVARLHAAGGVMLGKTTAPGVRLEGHESQSAHRDHAQSLGTRPQCRWLLVGRGRRCAAAGYGPLHQGGDGAGSIRIPAHMCGVFGLKATHGRVPCWPMSNNDLATHLGPITRTVTDAALMLSAMAGPHPWDYTSLEAPPMDYAAALQAGMRGKRIAYSPDLGHARVDPDVASLVESAVVAFTEMGATVELVAPAWGPLGPALMDFFWPTVFSSRLRHLPEWRDRLDPGFVALIETVARPSGFAVHADARTALRLLPANPRVLHRVGLPAYADRQYAGFSGRTAAAAALAAARIRLVGLGAVQLPVQLVWQPGGEPAVRVHRRGSPRRLAGRRAALR